MDTNEHEHSFFFVGENSADTSASETTRGDSADTDDFGDPAPVLEATQGTSQKTGEILKFQPKHTREQQKYLEEHMAPYPRLSEHLDDRTGLPTKSAFLSERFLHPINDEKNERFKDKPLLVCFLDFNSMGPPNMFGLGAQVDAFLEGLPELKKTCDPNGACFDLYRLGGDEFCIIAAETDTSKAAIEQFFQGLEDLRQRTLTREVLSSEDQELFDKAQEFANLRTYSRQIYEQFKEAIPKPLRTTKNFEIDVLQKLQLHCMQRESAAPLKGINMTPREANAILSEVQNGNWQLGYSKGEILHALYLLESEENTPEPQIMLSFTHGITRIDRNEEGKITPDMVGRALHGADRLVHAKKAHTHHHTPEINWEEISEYNPETEDAFAYEREAFTTREKEYMNLSKKLRETLLELHKLENQENADQNALIDIEIQLSTIETLLDEILFADPVVEQANRFDIVAKLIAERVLEFSEEGIVSIVEGDIACFGLINGVLGYQTADKIIKECTEQICSKIQSWTGVEPTFIRKGGGKFFVVMNTACQKQTAKLDWENIIKNIVNRALIKNVKNEILFEEIRIKRALRNWLEDHFFPAEKDSEEYLRNHPEAGQLVLKEVEIDGKKTAIQVRRISPKDTMKDILEGAPNPLTEQKQ